MTRSLVAGALLVLLALLGSWAAWAMYDLAAIYGDPAGSDWQLVHGFGDLVLLAVGVLVAVAVAAVLVARGPVRRVVLVLAVVLVGASVLGIVLGSHLGLEAKRDEGARAGSNAPHAPGPVREGQM